MTNEAAMKLYCFPPSSNSRKVLAVVRQLGIDVETEIVDLSAGAQRRPEYLAIEPSGRTPALVDGDFRLGESNAIMQYLAATAPQNGLWPRDERMRADISRWQCWQLAHWGVPINQRDMVATHLSFTVMFVLGHRRGERA